jgi:hypothetical protein
LRAEIADVKRINNNLHEAIEDLRITSGEKDRIIKDYERMLED